jgi:hypothetical protein
MVEIHALADIFECVTHASSPAKSVKSHPIVLKKKTSDLNRLDPQTSKSVIGDSAGMFSVDFG